MIANQPSATNKELITRLELFSILYRVLGYVWIVVIVLFFLVPTILQSDMHGRPVIHVASSPEETARVLRFFFILGLLIATSALCFSLSGLLSNRGKWSHIVTLCAVLCLNFPLGMAIGIPCLVLLSRVETRDYLDSIP